MTGSLLRNPMRGVPAFVKLNVTHSKLSAVFPELKFGLQSTVGELKVKLEGKCGTPAIFMKLVLQDTAGQKIVEMVDDWRPLGFYLPRDGFSIHIVDVDPTSIAAGGWLEDVSMVEKYVMDDEEYDKRENTFRKFRRELESKKELANNSKQREEEDVPEAPLNVNVGDRCEVEPGARRGEVRYVGQVEGLPAGTWIGVTYDEPVGKNDGCFKGKQYFTCEANYGGFLRPNKVAVGDFPPLDCFSDELDSGDEI